jgi:hypothetical protein
MNILVRFCKVFGDIMIYHHHYFAATTRGFFFNVTVWLKSGQEQRAITVCNNIIVGRSEIE